MHYTRFGSRVGVRCDTFCMFTDAQKDFIYLRSLSRNLMQAKELASRSCSVVTLSSTVAMPMRSFANLKRWQQFETRVLAVAHSTKRAVLCGVAAAAAWGIPYLMPSRNFNMVELCLPGSTSPKAKSRWQPGTLYRYGTLPAEHITTVNGMRVTTIEHTFIDLLRHFGELNALAFIEAAMYKFSLSKAKILRNLLSMRNIDGRSRAIALMKSAREGIQSIYETVARFSLEKAHLPGVSSIIPQAILPEPGQIYIPDLLIDGWLIIEIDGAAKYQQNPTVTIMAERERERLLLRRGYTILRFSPREVWHDLVPTVQNLLENRRRKKQLAA